MLKTLNHFVGYNHCEKLINLTNLGVSTMESLTENKQSFIVRFVIACLRRKMANLFKFHLIRVFE